MENLKGHVLVRMIYVHNGNINKHTGCLYDGINVFIRYRCKIYLFIFSHLNDYSIEIIKT